MKYLSREIKKIIFLASYPPRQCGIATFTQDLLTSMQLLLPAIDFQVCAINESQASTHNYPAVVTLQINQDDKASYVRAAKEINKHASETIVIVQHEYGIFGGSDGEYVVDFMQALKCPIATTLHTIVAKPDKKIRSITEQIVALSSILIVLTDSSLELLNSLYPKARSKSTRVLHGIHPLLYRESATVKQAFKLGDRRVMLTFGLLSRNKGIEYAIKAMPKVVERVPDAIYLIVGGTHPTVARKEGESYRNELLRLVDDLALQNYVKFIPDYLPLKKILQYLQATDIYIASTLDPNQSVSGTMSYALGAGRAVIATRFMQAKEVINKRIGRVVPIGNSNAIADAAIELLSKPDLLSTMSHQAYAETRSMLWTNCADEYINHLVITMSKQSKSLVPWPMVKWDHLEALNGIHGLLQFSKHHVPQESSGYTLDDNSRALQVVEDAFSLKLLSAKQHSPLSRKYLYVIRACLSHKPVVNYLSADTVKATAQNFQEDLSDSLARAYYALRKASFSHSKEVRLASQKLLKKIPDDLFESSHIRTTTQLLLGANHGLSNNDASLLPTVKALADKLLSAYQKNSSANWRWYDDKMTYANGQMCSSMLDAARLTGSQKYRRVGLESLAFLSEHCFMGEIYAPIGQAGWLSRGGSRALFDQQPEDALSMLQALESAYLLTHNKIFVSKAMKVFSWFMGNNLLGARVYDDQSGGCRDGLTKRGLNKNQGAESTLSYLQARLIVERLKDSI